MEEVEAKTGARTEEEDTAEDDKTADDAGGGKTADETAAEAIRKATERQCLRRERRRVDLGIGDKESGKRHSSDGNKSKQLKTGSGARKNDKDDTLPNDEGGTEAEDEKTEEDEAEEETEAGEEMRETEETETRFEVREARFEIVAPGCILAP